MVLLPCGPCCCAAGEPFASRGNPTSIEVDVVQGTDHSYSVVGTYSVGPRDVTLTASLPNLTGTYSLAEVPGFSGRQWRYTDANIVVEFFREGGASPTKAVYVTPKTALDGVAVVGGVSTTNSQSGGPGGGVDQSCNASNQTVYGMDPYSAATIDAATFPGDIGNLTDPPQAGGEEREAGRSGSFSVDCRLPVVVNASVRVRLRRQSPATWTETSNTFPGYQLVSPDAFTDFHYYHFDYSFTISAVRAIYPSETVPMMTELSPASCTGY
jgi:hypothetical protein